eukprot:evm.model.NODE_3634_length_32890_cov_30.974672.8
MMRAVRLVVVKEEEKEEPVISLCENYISCDIHDSWKCTHAPVSGNTEEESATTAVEPVLLLEETLVDTGQWWVDGSVERG